MITRGFVARRADRGAAEGDPGAARRDDRGRQRRGAHGSRAHQGEDTRGFAAVLPQALRAPAARAAGDHGDLTWRDPSFPGALASSSASAVRPGADVVDFARQLQPVRSGLVLHDRPAIVAPLNFGGRVGAFMAELSYQLLGYAAYLLPIVLVVSGWHYFWCRVPDAAYTKLIGAGLLFGCVSSFLSLAFGSSAGCQPRDCSPAATSARWLASFSGGVPEQDRLDHPDPDAALPVDHPLDAVLVRPALRRAAPNGPRSLGGSARRACARAARNAAASASARRC